MEINGNEKWLGKLKDSVGNFQAPVPDGFWDSLGKEIEGLPVESAARGRKRGIVPHLWYWGAAAAAVILVAALFFPTAEESVPGTEVAEFVPGKAAESVSGTEVAEFVPGKAEESVPGTKVAEFVPGRAEESVPGTEVTEFVPGKAENCREEKSNEEKESDMKEADDVEVREDNLQEALREALYLQEEKRGKKFWVAFSAGNVATVPQGGMVNTPQSSVVSGNELDFTRYEVLGLANLECRANNYVDMVGGTQLHSFINNSEEAYSNYNYSHRQPVRLGVSFAMELTDNISVESGLSYQLLRSDLNDGERELHQNLHYIGIPVKANIYFAKGKTFSAYAGAGFMVEKCVYGTIGGQKVNPGNWQYSVMANLGMQLFLGGPAYLYLEPGITRYLGMDEYVTSKKKGYMIETLYSSEPFGITIAGGVRFLF